MISRGALKSKQNFNALVSITYKTMSSLLKFERAEVTHPFFSFLESHCPHSGGIPILSRSSMSLTDFNYFH